MASKEKKSAIVSGVGWLATFWLALERAVKEAGGSDEDLHRLGTEEGEDTLRKMARVAVLRGECEILVPTKPGTESQHAHVPTTYQVTVDYGQSLDQMIAAGRYNSRNSDINSKNFPITGTGQVEVELHLVHLNKVASTEEVLAELDRRGLRPAKIEESLSFGAKYPNLQKEFPIVALGSVWRRPCGCRGVADLAGWDGERSLLLYWIESGWSERCRFAAVSK